MHAIRGGWVGQAFALATSNDEGGKKSRIRRSKEERKRMVESFVKKYQRSNNENFPSLNLTHKEVGGSFYTVREIVREIIQENKVLAPPKHSLEEPGHHGFMEQYPLGSISVEQQDDLSASDELRIAAPILPNQHQITAGELSSGSIVHSLGPELNNEQIFDGPSKLTDKEKVCDEASITHPVPNHYQDTWIKEVSNSWEQIPPLRSDELVKEKIVNRGEGLQENTISDTPHIKNAGHIHDQDNQENAFRSKRIHNDERYLNMNVQTVDKTKESELQVHMESVDMEIVSTEKVGGKDVEVSQVAISHENPGFTVERFPLRPVSRIILDLDGESGELHDAAGTEDDRGNKDKERAFVKSNSDLIRAKDEEKLPDSTLKNDEFKNEKVVLNLHEPSCENAKFPATIKASGLDVDDVNDSESKSSLPDETKASNSTKRFVPQDSASVGIKSDGQDENCLKKLDRINLGTWEGASKKSTRPETKPVLALVKAFISAFVKFWTE